MKRLIYFLLSGTLICSVAYSDTLPDKVALVSVTQAQTVLPDEQPSAILRLQEQTNRLTEEILEYRAKERFFSDMLSTSNMIWAALLALGGVVFGGLLASVSWIKYKNAQENLQRIFDKQLRKHMRALDRDRLTSMRIMGNLCSQQIRIKLEQNESALSLYYACESISCGRWNRMFFDSLDESTQKELIHPKCIEENISVILERLEAMDKIPDTIESAEDMPFETLKAHWNHFKNTTFYFNEGEEIKSLRNRITGRLQPYFDNGGRST